MEKQGEISLARKVANGMSLSCREIRLYSLNDREGLLKVSEQEKTDQGALNEFLQRGKS